MLAKINPSDKNLDFEYFVNLALLNKLPWDPLIVIQNDSTPTLKKSKEVIEILVKELEKRRTFEEDDQTNEKLVQSQEFGTNEVENQIFQESFEDDLSIFENEEAQFAEDFQDMNHGDESIEYDEIMSNEMLDRMGNQFYEFVGDDKEIYSDNHEPSYEMSNCEDEAILMTCSTKI